MWTKQLDVYSDWYSSKVLTSMVAGGKKRERSENEVEMRRCSLNMWKRPSAGLFSSDAWWLDLLRTTGNIRHSLMTSGVISDIFTEYQWTWLSLCTLFLSLSFEVQLSFYCWYFWSSSLNPQRWKALWFWILLSEFGIPSHACLTMVTPILGSLELEHLAL